MATGEPCLTQNLVLLSVLLVLFDLGRLINFFLDEGKALEGTHSYHYLDDFCAVCYIVLEKVLEQIVLLWRLESKLFEWRNFWLWDGSVVVVFFLLLHALLASEGYAAH
jgi:hypothetical protein